MQLQEKFVNVTQNPSKYLQNFRRAYDQGSHLCQPHSFSFLSSLVV